MLLLLLLLLLLQGHIAPHPWGQQLLQLHLLLPELRSTLGLGASSLRKLLLLLCSAACCQAALGRLHDGD
jgi:hypothetical protein